jgi:hypothetical protein
MLWSALGHQVELVSVTNGDIGHTRMKAAELAARRLAEVQEAAKIFGTTVRVLDIHDGELMPTLENRRTITRLIRQWRADIVISHRPNDYHPDHRYVGVLVQDSAFMVTVPFFCPDAKLDLSGELTQFFNCSYEALIDRGYVTGFNEWGFDPVDALPQAPYSFGSHTSKLVRLLRRGHYEVQLSQAELVRLVTWIDLNLPYYGSYYGKRNIKYHGQPGFRPTPRARLATRSSTAPKCAASRAPACCGSRSGRASWRSIPGPSAWTSTRASPASRPGSGSTPTATASSRPPKS